jgi:hypothetical protein
MPSLTGAAGLVLLLIAIGLTLALDLAGSPVGWRHPGPKRWWLAGLTAVLVIAAAASTWRRIHG